jgi:hypothetical protein
MGVILTASTRKVRRRGRKGGREGGREGETHLDILLAVPRDGLVFAQPAAAVLRGGKDGGGNQVVVHEELKEGGTEGGKGGSVSIRLFLNPHGGREREGGRKGGSK